MGNIIGNEIIVDHVKFPSRWYRKNVFFSTCVTTGH